MGLNFSEFMEEVGARPVDVSRETGLNPSIVVRVRDGVQDPSAKTMLKLNRWAQSVADYQHLPLSKRLSWDHILKGVA
jgi:hypothetical protein